MEALLKVLSEGHHIVVEPLIHEIWVVVGGVVASLSATDHSQGKPLP
jgi:hypothetical protein